MSAQTTDPLTTTANGRNHAPHQGGKVTVVILGNKPIAIPFAKGMTVGDVVKQAGQESSDPRIGGQSVGLNRTLKPGEEVTLVQRQAGG